MRNYGKITRLICSAMFVALAFSACSQARQSIQRSYVYTQAIFPGNIPVKRPGKPLKTYIDTATIIYVETRGGTAPVWDIAWKNGVCYNINVIAVKNDSVTVGRQKATMRAFVIHAQKGNRIWVVRFNGPAQDAAVTPVQKTNNVNQIVLGAKNSSRQVSLPLSDAIELEPERRP